MTAEDQRRQIQRSIDLMRAYVRTNGEVDRVTARTHHAGNPAGLATALQGVDQAVARYKRDIADLIRQFGGLGVR